MGGVNNVSGHNKLIHAKKNCHNETSHNLMSINMCSLISTKKGTFGNKLSDLAKPYGGDTSLISVSIS